MKEIAGDIYYMKDPTVKRMMACTMTAINAELTDLEKSPAFQAAGLSGFDLKKVNMKYLEHAYANANRKARDSIFLTAETLLKDKVPLHKDDQDYLEGIVNGSIELPVLTVPSESDASNCGPDHPGQAGTQPTTQPATNPGSVGQGSDQGSQPDTQPQPQAPAPAPAPLFAGIPNQA